MQSLQESLISQIKKQPSDTTSNLKGLLDDPTVGLKNELLNALYSGNEDIFRNKIMEIWSFDKKKKILDMDMSSFWADFRFFNPDKIKQLGISGIQFIKTGQYEPNIYPAKDTTFPKDFDITIKAPKSMVNIVISDDFYEKDHSVYKTLKFEGPKLLDKCLIRAKSGARVTDINSGPFINWIKDLYLNKKVYFGGGMYTSAYKWWATSGSSKTWPDKYESILKGMEKYRETGKKFHIVNPNDTNFLEKEMEANVPYNIGGSCIIIRMSDLYATEKYYGEEFWWNEVFSKVKRWSGYKTFCNGEFMLIY